MIDRRKTRGANLSPEKLAENLSHHRMTIRNGMATSPNFEVLEVDDRTPATVYRFEVQTAIRFGVRT